MIRSHLRAAVPGLIVSDVNFNFSCFDHNYGFCLLQVYCFCIIKTPCPIKIWSPGRYVLYKALKEMSTLNKGHSNRDLGIA